MNCIGVDCHISTLEFAVVNEKETITQKAKVNTDVKEFMAFVKNIWPSTELSERLIKRLKENRCQFTYKL